MKNWFCILLLCTSHCTCLGQHIFLSTADRKQVVDSLHQKISTLNREKASFQHDTNLFFSIDRYYYHLSQLNPRFSPTVDLQKLCADSMFSIARRNAWPQGIAIATVRQGRAAFNHRQDSTAFRLLQQGAALCRRQKLPHELGLVLINLATCLAYRPTNTPDEWQRAMTYMQQALHLAQRTHDPEVTYLYYDFMGDFHILRGQYDRALSYFDAAVPLLRKYPYLSGNRTNLGYQAICQLHLGHQQTAQRLLARFFTQSNPDEGTYAAYLHHIVLYEISQYHLKRQDYKQALHYLNQYSRILHQRPPIDHFKYHRSLSEIYEKTSNYRLALRHWLQYQAARDTIRSEEFSQQFATLEHRYQVSRRENQIQVLKNQALNQQNRIQQTRVWLLGISLVFVSGILVLLVYSDQLRRKRIQSELQLITLRHEANAQILEAQDAERARIAADIHDELGGLIATVNHQLTRSLQAQSLPELQQRITDIKTISTQAGDKIRSIAHNLMPPDFARIGLIESVQQLVHSLTDSRFSFALFGEPQHLKPEIELNAYRMLSELIHNVQKHAQAEHVSVQLLFHPDSLNLVVEDDGVGYDVSQITNESVGIGLKNISSRVNYLNARWHTDSSRQGTITLIEIPYAFVSGKPADRR
ncbi:histidine kinase [uncultured Spirosoma sp.]|uniref:histidine kinase n=1 Tax=uncultured Spirosoma sp. TaxID=278208 RepID=UPI002587FF80|nr:histidine kinase [uncultured Spirosoma sp.]